MSTACTGKGVSSRCRVRCALAVSGATHDYAQVEAPETRYAKTADGVHIAYQIFGRGSRDFVLVSSSWLANVELLWEGDWTAAFLGWFADRGRVVHFDRRGTGLSDGVSAETDKAWTGPASSSFSAA